MSSSGHHLKYTLPAVGVLWFVARPLLCRADVLKMSLASAAALAYATWWASDDDDDDHSPPLVERCASLASQTLLTLLWSSFCLRWSTPCFAFNFDPASYRLVRWSPIAALLTVVLGTAAVGSASRHLLLWSAAVAFLWYGAGNFTVKRMMRSAVAIVVPTLYVCWADRISRANDPAPDGEVAFFYRLAVGALVVLAANGYDKASGMMEAYTPEFPCQFAYSPRYLAQLFTAFMTSEHSMPAGVVRDLRKCFDVMLNESTTFAAAVPLLQGGTRLDMVVVYAFGRVTDEMFDNDSDPEKQQRQLKLCHEFVDEVFANRKNDFDVKRRPEAVVKIDWTKYESQFSDTEIATFRALARIAYYLPSAIFTELLVAFRWDVDGKVMVTEEDLMTYTEFAAGVTALIVCIVMYRDYNDKYFDMVEKGKKGLLIKKAYEMGQAVQIVNMARDIVKDSVELGRCYIPLEYMDNGKHDVKVLRQDKKPRLLGDSKLKKYANKLISLSDKFQSESESFYRGLPLEPRGLILAFSDIYQAYVPAIQSSPVYPTNAKIPKWTMIKIGLYSLYVKSLLYGI